MMNWKTILAFMVAAPFVALLGGVGVLAYNVSQTWDSRNTDALISGLVASCGMGGIVIAGLLAAIIGIPMAMRLMDKWRESDRMYPSPLPRFSDDRLFSGSARQEPSPTWRSAPPQIIDKQQGSWQTMGTLYDTWDEEDAATFPGEIRP